MATDPFPRIPPGIGNVNAFRPPRRQLLKVRLDQTGIDRQARRLSRIYREQLGQRGGLIAKTNRESLEWVKDQARSNLAESIKENRRPQFPRRDKDSLDTVIANDESHTVFNAGFRFMVTNKVRDQIDYAFSLEYGDRSQIGRDIRFLFLGRVRGSATQGELFGNFNRRGDTSFRLNTSHKRDPRRSNNRDPSRGLGVHRLQFEGAQNVVTDRIVGPREYGTGENFGHRQRTRVIIHNPVPQYAYGRKAGRAFRSERIYAKKLLEIFGTGGGNIDGIQLRIGNVGAARAINAINRAVSQNTRGS